MLAWYIEIQFINTERNKCYGYTVAHLLSHAFLTVSVCGDIEAQL